MGETLGEGPPQNNTTSAYVRTTAKKQGDKKNVTNPFRIATPSHGAKVFP